MIFNYQEISHHLLDNLSDKEKQIVSRRFGLDQKPRETLQAIGADYGVTRERVRQIEGACLAKLKSEISLQEPFFQFFLNQLKTSGKLRKEESLLKILSPEALFRDDVLFLLFLADEFERIAEDRSFYSFWTIDNNSLGSARKIDADIFRKIKSKGRPLEDGEIETLVSVEPALLFTVLEISKRIEKGPNGLWGLNDWPEINPRGIKDKALIILQKEKRPLHFRELAQLIDENKVFGVGRRAHPQTVHNELIKDEQFVLIGRGTYALKEWGYERGLVKDVIVKILEKARRPLPKDEIADKVLEQRKVKRNTILLNLRDKKLFSKNAKGYYALA